MKIVLLRGCHFQSRIAVHDLKAESDALNMKKHAGAIRHHADMDEWTKLRKDHGSFTRYRFESCCLHQRESANMIYAMKKRGISDKGRAVATG